MKKGLILISVLAALFSNQLNADDISGGPRVNMQSGQLTVPCVKVDDPEGEFDERFFDVILGQIGNSYELIFGKEEDPDVCKKLIEASLNADEDTSDVNGNLGNSNLGSYQEHLSIGLDIPLNIPVRITPSGKPACVKNPTSFSGIRKAGQSLTADLQVTILNALFTHCATDDSVQSWDVKVDGWPYAPDGVYLGTFTMTKNGSTFTFECKPHKLVSTCMTNGHSGSIYTVCDALGPGSTYWPPNCHDACMTTADCRFGAQCIKGSCN